MQRDTLHWNETVIREAQEWLRITAAKPEVLFSALGICCANLRRITTDPLACNIHRVMAGSLLSRCQVARRRQSDLMRRPS